MSYILDDDCTATPSYRDHCSKHHNRDGQVARQRFGRKGSNGARWGWRGGKWIALCSRALVRIARPPPKPARPPRVPLLANSISYERVVPCYRRAHASNPPGLGGRRGRAAWQPHANPRGEASVAIQECLGGHCQSPPTSPGEAAVVPGEAPSAEWDDCMLLGLILFWIVGNLLFCFLSRRAGRQNRPDMAGRLAPRWLSR
jgi:hypothetical protein